MATVTVTDNSEEVKDQMSSTVETALEKCGLVAEGYAKKLCPVDMGRLRNSITYATSLFSGVGDYTDNYGNQYSDATAKGTPEKGTVYIGTNVEYAPYVEMGTSRTPAKPFIRPAVEGNASQYRQIMDNELKQG